MPAPPTRPGRLGPACALSLALFLTVPAHGVGFFASYTLDATFGTTHLVHGDLDGDGDLDLVAIRGAYGDVVWFENHDHGTSWTERTIDTNLAYGTDVAVADIDGDGDLDIAAVAPQLDDLFWYQNNNGAGTSWTKRMVAGGFVGAYSVTAGDVNGDGKIDLVASGSNNASWWQNGGGGLSWTKRTVVTVTSAADVRLADVDGDGDQDVLVGYSGGVLLRKNVNGVGTSWTTSQVFSNGGHRYEDLQAGDFDGDGDLDVAAVGANDVSIWWFRNLGGGSTWNSNLVAGSGYYYWEDLTSGDIDNDGDIDLVGVAPNRGYVKWYENNGSGFSSSNLGLHDAGHTGVQTALLVDIGNDGDLDLVTSAYDTIAGASETRWHESDFGIGTCKHLDPKSWWSFDENTGSTAYDLVSNSDGTHVNGPTKTPYGKVDGALNFDGWNDFVQVPDGFFSGPDLGNAFTLEGWIKTSDSRGTLASKREVISGKYVGYLFMVYNGRLLLQLGDVNSSWYNYTMTSGPRVDDGNWHHVAVAVVRSSGVGHFYIDGAQVHSFNPSNRSASIANSVPLEIGRTSGGGDEFSGRLDELTMYSRELKAYEIHALYAAGPAGKCKTGQPPVVPLSLQMTCTSYTSSRYLCTASPSGGWQPYSYSWSYTGSGTLFPNGSSATIEMGTCPALGQVQLTVTDSAGATRSASQRISCSSTCSGSRICQDED